MRGPGLVLVLILALSGGLPAAEAGERARPFYLGILGGRMLIDDRGFDDVSTLGFNVGYRFPEQSWGSLAVEGELTGSEQGDVSLAGLRGDWDLTTLGVYVAYRTPGVVFFKARAGILAQDLNVSGVGRDLDTTESGYSGGLGFGLELGKLFSLEAEYTYIEKDIDFYSAGIKLHF